MISLELLKKTIESQQNKIEELLRDYERFKYNFPLDYCQKIDSVKNQSFISFKELREQSQKLAEDIHFIQNIFQPLTDTNIKRLKESIKYIYRKKYLDEEIFEKEEEKEKNKYLFYVERMEKSFCNILHLVNLHTNQIFRYELFKNSSFMNDAVWFKDLIFICGGGHQSAFLDICVIVDINQNKINMNHTLTQKKCFVNLLSTSSFVICIGGYNGKTLSTCEIFNTSDLKWIAIASLNRNQDRLTSILYQFSIIFTLGSCTDNTMEKLDINNDIKNSKWEILKVKGSSRSYGCAIILKSNKILIFGGEASCVFYCIFNPHKYIVKYRKEKFCEASFNASKPIYLNGVIWVVSEYEKKIYQISPETYSFEIKELFF